LQEKIQNFGLNKSKMVLSFYHREYQFYSFKHLYFKKMQFNKFQQKIQKKGCWQNRIHNFIWLLKIIWWMLSFYIYCYTL
jgi:hypothetical protein